MQIPVFSAEDLDAKSKYLGLKGSPTRVVKIDSPSVSRGGRAIKALDEESLGHAVDALLALLREKGIA